MNSVNEKLILLRNEMKNRNIDYVLVLTNDCHLSEYIGDHFKTREYISGFTGSAGVVLVGLENSILWTDGRYFLQAEEELKGSSIELYKMGEEGVPYFTEYLFKEAKGKRLACDLTTVSMNLGLKLNEIVGENNLINIDLIDLIWKDRPSKSHNDLLMLTKRYTGRSRANKLAFVQNHLKNNNVDAMILSNLDEIMWLFNIRGSDVKCNPVVLSYAIIEQDKSFLYLQKNVCNDKQKRSLLRDNVYVCDYDNFYNDLENIHENIKVDIDDNSVNYQILNILKDKVNIVKNQSIIKLEKAIKNKVEIKNMKIAHIKDAIAMVNFLAYVDEMNDEDELSLARVLREFRSQQDNFVEESFDTICGFNAHGAIVHYSADEKTSIKIKGEGLLLVDSGGQYLEGTTDITRTIVINKITRAMKRDFTLVLKGHLDLMDAKFVKGTRGCVLDVIAREPLWKEGKNYNHGTGHGVGCFLNVHEGPNNISFNSYNNTPIVPGMITSNEPGLYIENQYGIRHENLILCVKDKKNKFGQFYSFEPITLVPFDRRGIIKSMLTPREIEILNNYHQRVYNAISPYVKGNALKYLIKMTREI